MYRYQNQCSLRSISPLQDILDQLLGLNHAAMEKKIPHSEDNTKELRKVAKQNAIPPMLQPY